MQPGNGVVMQPLEEKREFPYKKRQPKPNHSFFENPRGLQQILMD